MSDQYLQGICSDRHEGQLVSVVVPCFNEEQTVPLFYPAIKRVSDELRSSYQMKMEFIFINDGPSPGISGKNLRCMQD